MEKPLQTLHKSLLSNNYDVPDDYESFEQTLTAKGKEGFQNRYTLWKSLNDNGYDVPDNYDDFAHTLFQPVQSAGKPQQTPTATPQQKPQPQPTSYPQAVKENLKGMQDNAGQKIVEGLDAIGAIDHGQTQTTEAPDDPVFGTPWGTQGSGTGQGKAYKAFAPGQVRETGDPGTPNYGIPYRPYTQMSAAARDELYRQNDYAVKQVQKMRDVQTRRNKPLVDTSNPDVNNSVIKTKGQWEDELQQGVSNISKSVVTPAVSKAIADFDKKAHEVFEGTQEGGNAYGGLPTGTASGATIFGNIKESNKANNPEKVLNYLKGQMEALYKDQSFIEKVGEEADKMGIDRNEYLEKVVKPQIEADLGKQFDSAMIDKYLPKSGKEYVVSGLSNSIIGMLADAFLETKGQRAYKNQAAAMTEEGQNPYYNPGTGAKLAQMGVSFAADAPFFGVYGKVSGQVAKSIAEREIKNLVAKGLSEGAARSVVGSALENSVGARMKNYIMQHVISGSLTMGGYNLTSEGARQLRDKEFDPMRLAGSTAEGLAVGAAFGITGGASQAFSQPLSGFSKIGAKTAGFGAEAETMYATEELAKMAQGEEGFTNPFEGSVEALEKLGVMKLSGGHLLESAGKKLIRSKEVGAKQVAGETLSELLGQNKSGVKFTEDEQNYIRNSQEGKDLVEALGNMHPDRAIEEVNGKKKFTKEGEQQRQVLAENYDRFMNNPKIPSGVKQKVSQMFGGIYRPGLETGATITQNEDGSVILKTRDKDGNCVRDLKFDNLTEAEQWRDQFKSQMSRNDAVNMFNSAPMEVQQNIVNIVKDEISGKTVLDELKGQAGTMKQNRLKRQLEKINQTAEQYEGREMTDEEARNYIQTVIKDGDDAVFNEMYDLIRENTHPSDELDTKRNYWEGQQLSTIERHKAQVDAQLAEERLRLQGDAFAEEVIGAADYPDEKMAELAMRASRGQITGDQLKAALDYYNKESKVRGMMDEALKSVDNQVEAANAYVRRNTHTDSGTLIEGSYQGRNYYVTAGHFQIGPDGKLVPTDNSGLVILRDRETGDIVTANPNDILVNGIQDPNRVIEYNESMEGLRGQLIREADDTITLRPDTPTEAANGDIYMGTDGNMYMAMAVQDEAGNPVWSKVPIDENGEIAGNPMEFDIAEYRKAKSDEKDAAEIPPEEAAAIVENQNVQVDENSLGKGAEGVGSAPDASEAVNIDVSDGEGGGTDVPPSQTEEPQPASSRIPVDKKGKKIYEQAKPEDTLSELTEKYGEEKAQQIISQIAESTTRALEEIKGRDTSKITDMAELEAYQDEVAAAQKKADYWNGIIRQREAAEAKKQELAKTHIDNMRKAKTLDDLEAAYQAAIKAGVPENELSEVYNAKKAWNNLVNPKEIRNFATDPESQAKWVDEHFDEIVDIYIKAHGNLLDPDKLRDALTPIGYNGKNVPDFKIQGKRLTKAVYDKMLQDAVTSGNRSITLLTGAGGAGKSKATESMDFSDRGIVYDSAFNNVKSLKDAINAAKAAGMTDVQVVAVYNDAATSFGNTIERGLKTGRFLALDYFVREAFMENQGKMAELKQSYPDVDIVCIDNSGNKSTERPDGGRVSVDEAANWDYTVNDAKLNELLDIFENGIDEGRFTEDQIASIGRGLHDVERVIADIKPATIERIGRIERRIRPEDVGDLRPGISREPMQLGGDNVVPTTDGEVQGSSEERPSEGVEGTTGKGAPAETRTNEEAGNGRSDTRPASGSDDDGPEPPAAGGGTAVPATDTGAEGSTRTGLPANDGRAGSVSGGSDGTGSSGTGGTESGSGKSEVSPAKRKIYHNTVEANRGRKFTVTLGNGNRSVITIKHIDYKGDAVLIRQDYDPQGNPIGEPRQESYPFDIVGKAIVENKWNKQLDADEELRQNYKYHTRKSGDIPIIDVLTDNEKQQMLDALRSGDTEKAGYLESEFIRNHDKDFILRGREIRNEKVEKALARSGKGERLRGVREQYRGNDEALSMLEDGAMEPQSIEEYVADALGDVPKMGKGFLAYTSYEKGGNKIVGLKDETGFGGRSFGGDTKGFNPWLAPKGQGISLKQFAERIHESLPEGMQQQYSDQDIRNIIHNVMTGAEKPTDIANYILRNRLEEAEASMRRMEDDIIDHMADDVPVFQKVVDDNSFANRLQRANESVNQEPTDGQKKAGNYKKGHISFGGYDFTIENPAGSVRRGTDADGKPWEQKMNNTYGYILGKRGKDGDHLDFFINDKADLDNWNGKVYVVDQVKPDGSFDEHKILYGFDSEAEAREAYLSNYEKDWKGLGKITGVDKATFDKWLDASDYKIKDFADYSIVKHKVEQQMRNFDTALKQLNTRGISIDNQELLDKYGLKNVVLSKTGDHLTLTHFIVDQQGQGYGTRFMEDLARLADEKGWTLALTPGLGFGAKSKKKLEEFYKRFGFVANKGRNADFQTRESMIRRPKEFMEKPENQEKVIRDAVVEYLKSIGIDVSTDWKLGQKILDEYNGRLEANEEPEEQIKSQKVIDQTELDELNKGKTVKRYRAMQLIDGKLYPPMSAKVDGEMRQPTEIGVWEKAEERPDLIKNGKFVLNKGQKGQGNVPAAYNPYFHTSTSGLNDQFTSAYKRPELVVVEVEIPESELTSGYKAEGAKDAVGNVDWHSGVVNGQLPADRQRQVTLSRYSKVNRIVPDSEVADMIAKQLEGTDIEVPYNVVTPKQREELEKRGVKISDKPAGKVTEDINGNPIKEHKVVTKFFKTSDGYAYGYTKGGKIYVDPLIATAETPIHEYDHLWCEMKRQTAPEEWNEIKQVMLNDEVVKPIIDRVKRDYEELTKEGREDDFVEEIITQFSGKRGAERLREVAEEVAKENGGIFGKAEAITAMQRLKNILNRFWEGVAKMMGWKYRNANQIADRIMADMLNGMNPRQQMKNASAKVRGMKGERGPVFVSNAMKAVEAIKQEKGTPEQWLKMIEKAGGLKAGEDKWIGLSDYLEKAKKDGNPVYKEELLDFIRDNQIEIEEQHYSDTISKEAQDKLNSFNTEFDQLIDEGEEATESIYTADWVDWAYEQMVDRYGDDFRNAFEIQGNGTRSELVPIMNWNDELSGEAKYFLGMGEGSEQPINGTRLSYTTEGLDNKKEIALTVPTIEPYNEGDEVHFGDAGNGRAVAWVRFGETTTPVKEKFSPEVQAIIFVRKRNDGYDLYKPYGSHHSLSDNYYILYRSTDKDGNMGYVVYAESGQPLHVADNLDGAKEYLNDYLQKNPIEVTDNKHVLVIDEIQSKRHQDAREKGYKGKYKAYRSADDREWLIYDENDNKLGSMPIYAAEDPESAAKKWGVPDAPFEKNWHELAMKRMLRYAAENGFDKIAWTTGGQQAERYNIGTVIDEVGCTQKWEDGKTRYDLYPKSNDGSISLFVKDGKVINSAEESLIGKNLSEVVGKDLAEKMQNMKPDETLSNDELLIGGEGMKGFYDQILPRFMDKYGKKWGVKTGEVDLPKLEPAARKMHSIDVTPEMRESVMQGQPMFQKVSKTDTDKTLMGVHNISEEKLKNALKQGGLANPSMAVFDTKNYAHTDYGEISLIPRSSLIDSRTGRNAGTYSGDAWTPTYPSVSRFLTKKGDKRRLQIAKEAAGGDSEMERHLAGVINDWVEGNGDRMHFLFLKQKGLNPEVRPERTTHSHEEFEEIQKIFGEGTVTLPSDFTKEQSDALLDLMTRGYEEQIRKQAEMIKDESKREAAIKAMLDRKLDGLVDENGKIWFAKGDSFVYENWRDEQRRKNPKPDWYGTDNDASYRVAKEGLAEEYEKWKENLLGDEDIDEKLFAGWTADGNKRYVANTVQNASRLMNKESETNAYGNGGVNASKAGLLKKLKSLAEIRKYRHLLKNEDQIKEQQQQASDEWFDIIKQVSDMQKIDSNPFINVDIAEARLQEAITMRDPISYMNKEYGYNIDKNSELASDLMNFIDKAKEMPVKYFETKFKRPVGIDEFAVAVVPTTTSPEVVKALQDAGLEIKTYEKGDTGDPKDEARIKATMDAVKGRDDIMFQRVGSQESEMTPEERQYWNQWDKAMKKWKEKNAIPDDQTEAPEKPRFQQGESALDYAKKLVQWNREKSIWQTAPKIEDYRKVREDKDLLEAARENEKRYPDSPSAKMRRVAAEFQQIRSAMSRQKAYDKATVKAVTDFAQEFMKLGFGDNLSRGEMERMLSSVKNATGAKDIKKEVDNIMNILIDNHLRQLDQRVQKLSSVKELSKTAQGVEKQGRLELKGQRMIQAFREAREKRMTVDQIRERMAEVSEKMNRNDEEAPMWEQEYEGLSIALQYAENIEGSRQEWGELDQIYKDAVKEYKTSGRSYKAQQELLESIDQAMQENKIERIGLFGDIIGRLEGNISESMQGAKEFVEREKQRIKHIQDIANYDLAGKDMGAIHQSDWKKRLSNGTASRFFLSPLATFEQMLKQFGGRNANGEGYLYDHFMRSWIDSVDKSFVNEQKAKEELDAKAREVFGDKVKRWSDLYELERRMPKMEVTISDQGEDKTFTLNQGNLLYIYMADKMTDGRMKLRKMGIDEEHIEAIKDFLDPRIKELGDWIQSEYLPKKRTEYNKVHERMFGAPMAAIDNYFPIKILGDARIQEQDVANMPDQDAVLPSTITGSIVKRRKNALPLDILGTDALSLAVEHIEDMERWAAQAEWNKDVNTLLSYTTFRNKVKNMNTIYGSGDQLWNTFADTARMAAGTYRPKAKPGSVDKAISNIAKGVTAAKINFRVYTAFKQILSAPAFLHDVNLGTFVKNSVNPHGSWKWAMENMPVFQKRWKSRQVGDTRLMDDPTDWKMWKNNVVQLATRMGMSPNALVDGVTCAVGAKSIYETRYKQYKDIGASDEVARKRALQDAEIGYNLTQQSSEGAFVSAIQKDRTVAASMLSVFRNSSMAYTRQWVDAARNLRHRAQKGYKDDSIKFMAGQLEQRFDMEPEDAKKMAEAEYARAARHDVARLLNMMFGVTTAWNLGASLPYLLLGDDDHTKKEMVEDALIKGLVAGPTEGLAAGNLYSDFIGRTLASEQTRKTVMNEGWGAGIDAALSQGGDYEVNPLPLMADIQSMIKKMGYDKYAAAQDVFNICMQSAVGVNPQTFTDMWNACMDYGNPEWMPFTKDVGNDDLANSKEIALFIMRLMNAPTSSWRNKYIDELGMNAEDAKKLPYEEMARRYANYKHWKDAPIMGWLRGEKGREEKMKKIQKQFDKAVEERMERLTDEELASNLLRSGSAEEKKMLTKIAKQRLGISSNKEDGDKESNQKNKWYQKEYQRLMDYNDIKEDELLNQKMRDYREYDNTDKTRQEVKKRIDWIRDGKYDSENGRKGKHKNPEDDPELVAPGKKQLDPNGDTKQNEAILKNIRKWRKEALEILMRGEAVPRD